MSLLLWFNLSSLTATQFRVKDLNPHTTSRTTAQGAQDSAHVCVPGFSLGVRVAGMRAGVRRFEFCGNGKGEPESRYVKL